MKTQEGFSSNVLRIAARTAARIAARTAARTATREAEGFLLNCSTKNVVLGGQSRGGARADCAYDGAYGGAGS